MTLPLRSLSSTVSAASRGLDTQLPAAPAKLLGKPQGVGDWELGQRIGMGGVSDVYVGTRGDAVAAVKVTKEAVAPGAVPSPALNLAREHEVLSRLQASRNVVDVIETGLTSDHRPYLAMELLGGKSLERQLREQGRLSTEELVGLVGAAASALDAARLMNITHLDLKPANLVWDSSAKTWKLIDFGNAKLGRDQVHQPTPGMVTGTPSYMSPEHVGLEAVDHRSDLFALAATAYEGVTGRRAFVAGSRRADILRNLQSQPPRPSGIAQQLPEAVDSVLAVGLARDPALRFATAGEFSEALGAATTGELSADVKRRADDLLSAAPWKW